LVELHCDAILFDMDGVLVDSRPVVERVWQRWCALRGFDPSAILRVAHGRRTEDTLRALGSDLDVAAELRWLEDAELSDREGVSAVPGAVEFVNQIPEGRWAVVTSAGTELARRRLEWCGVPTSTCLIAADVVGEGKPSPEGYLRAASELRAQPAGCVVVEDSPAGIAAARSAGMRVVGVTTTHEPGDLPPVDALLEDLTAHSLERQSGRMILRVSDARWGAF
jgi:sugar-phosphatase